MISKQLRNIAKRIVYGGTKYKCTICGSNIRTFFPNGLDVPVLTEKRIVGGYKVANGKCPVCKRNERERLIFKYLFQYLGDKINGTTVLHVAPEYAIAKKFKEIAASKKINYKAGDKFEAGYNYDCEQLDITQTNHPDNTFDILICNHVLEHVPNDKDAMQEIYRILKPGGQAILQVPVSLVLEETYEDPAIVDSREREEKFGQYDHVRIYGKDYAKRLESVGFKMSILNPKELWGEKAVTKEGINPEEKLYIAIKP